MGAVGAVRSNRFGAAAIYAPGEIEYRMALALTERGIPIPVALYDELIQLGNDLGVKSALSV